MCTTMNTLRKLAKEFSGDRKTQVGAGVYFDDSTTLKWGVNHLGCELDEEEIVNRTPLFYDSMIHAECDMLNKLEESGEVEKVKGKTVYVTLFPCDNCARRLIAAGVKKVIAGDDRPTADYIIRAKELFDKYGVEYEVIK